MLDLPFLLKSFVTKQNTSHMNTEQQKMKTYRLEYTILTHDREYFRQLFIEAESKFAAIQILRDKTISIDPLIEIIVNHVD